MKKIAKILFGRMFFVGVVILLQVAWLLMMLLQVGEIFAYSNTLLHILSVILVMYLINRQMNPSFKLAWTFLILLFPLLGLLLYYLFGRSELTKKTRAKLDRVDQEIRPLLTEKESDRLALEAEGLHIAGQSAYLTNWAGFPVYRHTGTDYYACGEEMFPVMLREIRRAKKFIFLEYFIISEGEMFNQIIATLEEKAKEGVTVRLIYDDVGCINTLPAHFYRELEQKGIHCAAFHPFRPFLSVIMNNRDHRKILVVDGNVAFTGGINIADEYINRVEKFGYWKDTGVRLIGEAVWSFTCMFLETWNYICGSSEDYERFRPSIRESESTEDGYVQPYGDSPLDHENTGENVYMNIIGNARRYVYIFTPYLILDHEMLTCLCNAAKRGVDVRIVTPGIPDKKTVYLLTQADYGVLIESGVRIYHYMPGFIHAKSFVCDDEIATVGSINLDYRSLYLHFECGVFMYKSKAVQSVKEDAIATMDASREITLEFCRHRLWIIRFLQSFLRLLAPLL